MFFFYLISQFYYLNVCCCQRLQLLLQIGICVSFSFFLFRNEIWVWSWTWHQIRSLTKRKRKQNKKCDNLSQKLVLSWKQTTFKVAKDGVDSRRLCLTVFPRRFGDENVKIPRDQFWGENVDGLDSKYTLGLYQFTRSYSCLVKQFCKYVLGQLMSKFNIRQHRIG